MSGHALPADATTAAGLGAGGDGGAATAMSEAIAVDAALVAAMARLAGIQLSHADCAAMVPEFGRMLEQLRSLAAVDVAGVAPMRRPALPWPPWRADVPGATLPTATLQALAPRWEAGGFAVPRVLEG